MEKRFLFIMLFILTFVTSCTKVFYPSKLEHQTINVSNTKSSEVLKNLIAPYSDSVNKTMQSIIVYSEVELVKKQPEGNLGNFLADAMLFQSKLIYNNNIDACFINSGGIRLPSIAAGAITKGKFFEVAPFDNTILILSISGKTLNEFINHISAKGGWPTAGASYQIKSKKAENILINKLPIDDLAVYKIAVVDYVANGGDDCKMLINLPREDKGYLFRSAILDFASYLQLNNKKINTTIENRVTNAE